MQFAFTVSKFFEEIQYFFFFYAKKNRNGHFIREKLVYIQVSKRFGQEQGFYII